MSEIVPAETMALARVGRLTAEDLRGQIEAVEELVRNGVLRDNHDYGNIPGTGKPTLFKSGAERLLLWGRLGHRMEQADLERDNDGRKYGVTYRCIVHSLDDPTTVIATCDGYCGYDEPDREAHQNKWGKKVERSPWNTVIKMAQKRALVGATLQATGTSSLFTQDLEDMAVAAEAGGVRNDQLGDVAKLSNRDVVDALKSRGLPLAGKPDELRVRLAEALGQQPEAPADPSGETPSPVSPDAPSPIPSHGDGDTAGAAIAAPAVAAAPAEPSIEEKRLQGRLDRLPTTLRHAAEDELTEANFMPGGMIACTVEQVKAVSKVLDRFEEDANGAPGLQARAAARAKGTAA